MESITSQDIIRCQRQMDTEDDYIPENGDGDMNTLTRKEDEWYI